MEYRTVEGVEIATVGMDWPTSAGEGTFTFENLSDAMEAANNDPHIRLPRGKIGHQSEVNGALATISPFAAIGDAEPSFGLYQNLRLTNEGAALVADWVEVPAWLADASPSAFPSRSIEAARDVTTEGGKRYTMVITAVSSLGTALPAVTDLDDLQRFMIEGPDLGHTAAAHDPEEGRMPEATAASVDTGTIRQRFNFEWTLDNEYEGDTYWWWCRSVRVDPNEIVADDDDGGIWLIPFETDGKDQITFGEPAKVREEFVPVSASATSVVARHRERAEQRVLASNLERPDKPAPKTAASQPEKEDNMDPKKIRETLGLAEDATDEQVYEKLEGVGSAAPEGDETVVPTDEIPEETPAAVTEDEPVAASVAADRGVTLDKDAHAQLKAEAAEGRTARQEQLAADRTDYLSKAVKAGKFPPAAKAAYRTQLDKGGEVEAATRKFIDELPANTVPVTEIGAAGGDDAAVAASAALPGSWFPELTRNGANGAQED